MKSDTSAFKQCVKVQMVVLVNSFNNFQTVVWAGNGNMKTEKGRGNGLRKIPGWMSDLADLELRRLELYRDKQWSPQRI